MPKLTHFNNEGAAHMVDVGAKDITNRTAIAQGYIEMTQNTLDMILAGNHKKGDVLGIARIAGIMASKKTSELIPLCHTLNLSSVDVKLIKSDVGIGITCIATVKTTGQTGVEMEALTAVQIALLTIYDMCKAVDRGMIIKDCCLIEKMGGKSGHWKR
ncbi:MAG: cyclic pyranopterin monophosphate synthase MoaC [Gammaproteobacteria bacterium]